jgi:ribosomal protein S18 acetylase RimI-like enzyme
LRLRRLSLHERIAERAPVIEAYAASLARSFASADEAEHAAATEVDRWLAVSTLEVFELRADGARVGTLWLELAASGVAFVMYLAVEPAFRRRGHAAAALEEAEIYAMARGARRMGLSVFADNDAALGLYLESGYEIVRRGDARFRLGKLLAPPARRPAPAVHRVPFP